MKRMYIKSDKKPTFILLLPTNQVENSFQKGWIVEYFVDYQIDRGVFKLIKQGSLFSCLFISLSL